MKKALIVASIGDFLGFEKNNMLLLESMGYEIDCAANFEFYKTKKIDSLNVGKINIPFSRKPFCKTNYTAYKMLKKIVDEGDYSLVHCHTPIGGVVARLVCRMKRKEKKLKVIYTAHGFHFFKGAPLINWLLYYPVEKTLSRYTDVLITLNKEDYERASKHLNMKKVEYVPGVGIDIEKIENTVSRRDRLLFELKLEKKDILVLSVGELSYRKNHQLIIRCLPHLQKEYHYLIAGSGDKEQELKNLSNTLGVANRVHFLGYREDAVEIMKSCDIFAFPSKQEGLPVALMEAMACGLPCIASNIRGNCDIIEDGVNGRLFDLRTMDVTYIVSLLKNSDIRSNEEKMNIYDTAKINSKNERIYKKIT